jgi:hypothetical protein
MSFGLTARASSIVLVIDLGSLPVRPSRRASLLATVSWLLTPSPLFPPKFSALLQACADDVPADPEQAGRFQLIAIAIFVGGAHHVSFNSFVKVAATLLEEAEEGILERFNGMVRQCCRRDGSVHT